MRLLPARRNAPERDRELEELAQGQLEVDPAAIAADPELRQPRFRKVLDALAQRQRALSTRQLMDETALSRTSVVEVLQGLVRRRLAAPVAADDPAQRDYPRGTKLHRPTRAGLQAVTSFRQAAARTAELDPEAELARWEARRPPEPPAEPRGPWQDPNRVVEVTEERTGPVVVLRAVDRSPGLEEGVVVGQLYLRRGGGDDRTFGGRAPGSYASAENLWTSPTDEDADVIARKLHAHAAAIAASWGLPLGSGVELTVTHDAWWRYQAGKGRAQLGGYRGPGGYAAHRWFLGYPPPASLENPGPPVDPRDVFAPFGEGLVLHPTGRKGVHQRVRREAAERSRQAFLAALLLGAAPVEAAKRAGRPVQYFTDLAASDWQVRVAMERAWGQRNPDDRLRRLERAGEDPVRLMVERARAGKQALPEPESVDVPPPAADESRLAVVTWRVGRVVARVSFQPWGPYDEPLRQSWLVTVQVKAGRGPARTWQWNVERDPPQRPAPLGPWRSRALAMWLVTRPDVQRIVYESILAAEAGEERCTWPD